MSKLNNFVNNGVNFLSDVIFNAAYWLTYLCTAFWIGLILLCIPTPPTMIVGAILLLGPIIAYGLAWAVVGVAALFNFIGNKLSGYSPLKSCHDDHSEFVADRPSIEDAVVAGPQYQQAQVVNDSAPQFNPNAAQYANLFEQPRTVNYDDQSLFYAQP